MTSAGAPEISLRRCADSTRIVPMKQAFLAGLTAPMDGMWESGLIPRAPHWEVHVDARLAGFSVITDEGVVIQSHLQPAFLGLRGAVLDALILECGVSRAIVPTVDPVFLQTCLERAVESTVHSRMYEMLDEPTPSPAGAEQPALTAVDPYDLEATVDFQISCLGGRQSLRAWLLDYSGTLVERGELLLLHDGDEWLGLGELRRSRAQPGVADVGMMVSTTRRREGWGSEILRRVARMARAERLRTICSTTEENRASQGAIARAGFTATHRILEVRFSEGG